MSEVWEKQDFESAKMFKLFCIYRDMGQTRTLQKVCEHLGKKIGYRRNLEFYSSKYKWVARSDAYDIYITEENRKLNESEIREMKKRHIQQALLMQKNVISRIQDVNPREMSLADCVKMFDTAVKIERLSRDCDSEKTEIKNNVIVETKETIERKKLENLTTDELEELEYLMKKIEKTDEK